MATDPKYHPQEFECLLKLQMHELGKISNLIQQVIAKESVYVEKDLFIDRRFHQIRLRYMKNLTEALSIVASLLSTISPLIHKAEHATWGIVIEMDDLEKVDEKFGELKLVSGKFLKDHAVVRVHVSWIFQADQSLSSRSHARYALLIKQYTTSLIYLATLSSGIFLRQQNLRSCECWPSRSHRSRKSFKRRFKHQNRSRTRTLYQDSCLDFADGLDVRSSVGEQRFILMGKVDTFFSVPEVHAWKWTV